MGPHTGGSGCGVVQQGLGAQGAPGDQEARVGLEVPSLQGCPQLQPGQGFLGGPEDLAGLSCPLGLGCQCLPWGQWAQEAPGHQLDLGGLHPRGCPGQLGSPRVGRGPRGQLGLGALPAQ